MPKGLVDEVEVECKHDGGIDVSPHAYLEIQPYKPGLIYKCCKCSYLWWGPYQGTEPILPLGHKSSK